MKTIAPWIARLISDTKEGARIRGIPWGLSDADVVQLVHESGMRCAITGVRFSFEWHNGWRRRPWIPTLDRIDARRGYVRSNVRLISFAANHGIREWGDEVFDRMIAAAGAHGRARKASPSPQMELRL